MENQEDLIKTVLRVISSSNESVCSTEIASKLSEDHQKIVGALKSIQSSGDNIINCEESKNTSLDLTEEGKHVLRNGSHEVVLFNAIPKDVGILQSEIMKNIPYAKVGFSKAIAAGWIKLDKKSPGGPRVFRVCDTLNEDHIQQCLESISALKLGDVPTNNIADFKKRKLISENRRTVYLVSRGERFSLELTKEEADLTDEMLANGSWREKRFKSYNFNAKGRAITCGHLHPLLKVRTEFRQIFLEMGFSEMPTNNYVESSFWNFDALFQPQQHPARDAHDTFFVSDPASASNFPEDYLEEVKRVHSRGGFGSDGHGYDWSREEAAKNIMRTHTTAVSARMLYRLAQEKPFRPMKYFSIDRVFRNESLDATHLAEFHQIEGLVADRGLSLGHLMGIIQEFFHKLGIKKLRFKPAFNPYTEPSMEIFSYHEGLQKWVEIGNSGVFRPEMLLPMGIPEDISVIAWGLSVERPTMIKYGYNNIRDLFGPSVQLQKIYDAPVCRLDKN